MHPPTEPPNPSQSQSLVRELTCQTVTNRFLNYFADVTVATIPTKISVKTAPNEESPEVRSFKSFVFSVVRHAGVEMQTLLVTLVYIERAGKHIAIEGELPFERVFLSAIIVANKYISDRSFQTKAWASTATSIFERKQVMRMEREFLKVLDFELSFKANHISKYYHTIMHLVSDSKMIHRNPAPVVGFNQPMDTRAMIPMRAGQIIILPQPGPRRHVYSRSHRTHGAMHREAH